MSRVLKTGKNQITQTYAAHSANVAAGKAWAKGIDVVKYKTQIDKITAHSAGKVIKIVNYLSGTNGVIDREGMGYGNYVMLLHNDNYVTLYAHLEAVYVHEGQTVTQGNEIGLMGNTGNSFGTHLHFEVRKYRAAPVGNLHDLSAFEWLDAGDWLDKELPSIATSAKLKAGAKFELKDTSVYNTETGPTVGKRSGVYYIWSAEVKNGRVRMTNSAVRVGINGQVSFWVCAADILPEKSNAAASDGESSSSSTEENKSETVEPSVIPVTGKTYTVRAGDSLWTIATKQLGNGGRYKEIMSLNGLKDDVIYAGQTLKMPR